jgi:hypothetical protein
MGKQGRRGIEKDKAIMEDGVGTSLYAAFFLAKF